MASTHTFNVPSVTVEVETWMDDEDKLVKVIVAIRNALSTAAEELNDILKTYAPEETIPKIDLAELAALPWTSYQTKQTCTSPSEPGWIMNDASRLSQETQGYTFDELVKAIEGSKGKIQLGDMEYRFSGPKDDKKLFISRRSVRKNE